MRSIGKYLVGLVVAFTMACAPNTDLWKAPHWLQSPCNASCNTSIPDSVQMALNYQPRSLLGYGNIIERNQIVALDTVISEQYDPPVIYRQWWEEVQKCSGLTSTVDITTEWSWVQVPGQAFTLPGQHIPFPAYTAAEHHNFFLVEERVMERATVEHEMIHALQWLHGLPLDHPPALFNPCGLQGV